MFTKSFLLALSASTVLALPYNAWKGDDAPKAATPASSYTPINPSADNGITVVLANAAKKLEVKSTLFAGRLDKSSLEGANTGPFSTVNILVGKNVQNKDIRCKLLDKAENPIQATRGPNDDITFSDGGNGEWTFKQESRVFTIICDPAFKKATAPPASTTITTTPAAAATTSAAATRAEPIRVLLANQAIELGVTFNVPNSGKREEVAVRTTEPFREVTITSPAAVKDTLRCQIVDKQGNPVVAQRNANIDTTFSDGAGGKWVFRKPASAVVAKIVCDPAFVKGDASGLLEH